MKNVYRADPGIVTGCSPICTEEAEQDGGTIWVWSALQATVHTELSP